MSQSFSLFEYAEFIIRKKIGEIIKKPDFTGSIKEIIEIIDVTNQQILQYTLSTLYKTAVDYKNDKDITDRLNFVVLEILRANRNRPNILYLIRNSLSTYSEFPNAVLDCFSSSISVLLSISLFNSQYAQNAMEYFNAKLQNMTDKSIFTEFTVFSYEVAIMMNKDNYSFIPYFPIIEEDKNTCESIISFKNLNIKTVISELGKETLTSINKLMYKLSFLPDITAKDCAELLYHLSSTNSNFYHCFEKDQKSAQAILLNIQTVFNNFNITFTDLIKNLDFPLPDDYSNISFKLLFDLLYFFNKNETISSKFLLSNWKNRKLQYEILKVLTKEQVYINIQSNSPGKLSTLLDISDQISNICWTSEEFTTKIIDLASNNIHRLKYIFSNINSHSILTLINLYCNNKTEKIMEFSRELLGNLIFPNASVKELNFIWNNASSLLLTISPQFQVTRKFLENILPIFDDHIKDFTEKCNFDFLIDIINFAIDRYEDILVNLVNNFSEIQILTASDQLIRKSIAENSLILPKTIYLFFSTIKNKFNSLSLNTKLFVQFSYTKCCNLRNPFKIITWNIEIDQQSNEQSKEDAKEVIRKLQTKEKPPEKIYKSLIRARMHNFLFFQQSINLLISNIVNQDSDISLYCDVIVQLISSKDITSEQLHTIVDHITYLLSINSMQKATELLQIIKNTFHIILNYDKIIIQLSNEPKLSDIDHELYISIVKQKLLINKSATNRIAQDLEINHHLKRFSSLENPKPRVVDAMRQIKYNPKDLHIVYKEIEDYSDWISLEVVNIIEQNPSLVESFVSERLPTNYNFNLVEAACFRALSLIINTNFEEDNTDDLIAAHNLYVLGTLIGELTLKHNIGLQSRCIDLKSVILHSVSYGKMNAVVPFVCEIIDKASPFFNPPNPYLSGILHLLSGIYALQNVKLPIKNCIRTIFDKFSVNLSMFDNIPMFFPEKIQNNSDFVMIPFSLSHLSPQTDIDRLTSFDEHFMLSYIKSHVIIPHSDLLTENPELSNSLSKNISENLFEFIKTECKELIIQTSSTVSQLVGKDFTSSIDQQAIPSVVNKFTSQISSCLSLFSTQSKLSRLLINVISSEIKNDKEIEYINDIASVNYEWSAQFIRDLVKIASEKSSNDKLQTNSPTENSQNQKNFTTKTFGLIRSNLQETEYKVYEDFFNRPVSLQPFNKSEFEQNYDIKLQPDVEFMKFIEPFTKLIPIDTSINSKYDVNYHENAISLLMTHMPKLKSFMMDTERFQSILKTFFMASTMLNHEVIDRVINDVLTIVNKSVNKKMISESKHFILYWLKTSIRSIPLITTLINLKYVKTCQFDKILTDLLNVDPFNSVNAMFCINFLYHVLIKEKQFSGLDFINSLSNVITINLSFIENDLSYLSNTYDKIQECGMKLKTLSKFYFNLCLHNSNFDQQKEFTCNNLSGEQMMNITDDLLQQETKYLLLNSLAKFILSEKIELKKIDKIFNSIYNIFFVKNVYTPKEITLFLHTIRPTIVPSFAFCWIQILTNSKFVKKLIEENEESLALLITDYIKILPTIDRYSHKAIFDKIYVSFLRFLLILIHDFPQFVSDSKIFFLITFPVDFVQIRNIINTISEKPMHPLIDLAKMQKEYPIEIEFFEDENLNQNKLKNVVSFLEEKCVNQVPLLFCILKYAIDSRHWQSSYLVSQNNVLHTLFPFASMFCLI
ncbi:hypothetical protein TVAG_154400 [Trichomonas vaginalis G3]|uniref:Uncharacterized protein n=1 Tax=Trichomonas vaginalis (strain ATCC PRA-98 / G3) TaxID=412133 RepID=A2E446_TRIV3|nr:hypothetical protein TVAG_154400 [Trichomonas vaginalis G3]|eukprot:XP_001324812.1 hypothetical protein [Trichomonas vaginalis G3]